MPPASRISFTLALSLALHAAALPLLARDADRAPASDWPAPVALRLEPTTAPRSDLPPSPAAEPTPPPVEPAPPARRPRPVAQSQRPAPESQPPAPVQISKPEPEPRRPDPAPAVHAAAPVLPSVVQAAPSPGVEARRRAEEEYKAALRAALARLRRYPTLSRRLGQEGRVEVGFEVLADGRLRAVRVVRGSGHRRLDRAAVETVERLGRFRPLPPELGRERWELVLPLDYRLL